MKNWKLRKGVHGHRANPQWTLYLSIIRAKSELQALP